MKKTKQLLILLLVGSIFLTGCGKVNSSNTDKATSPKDAKSTADNTIASTPDANALNPETPAPTTGTFAANQGYSDADREVSVLGLKEYKKLKSDKYNDKAKNGKKYLVLFLKVRNRTSSKIYFHVDYLSAKIDGKKIKNTVLFNEPEGYPTIFANIAPDSYYGGYIAWEVPENWKKLEVTYEGWRDSDGLTLNSAFTRKDLAKPERYSESAYISEDVQ